MDGSHPILTRPPLHEAERDFETALRQTPGVTRADADLDIMRLAGIADQCLETARKAWREYRATGDESDKREFTTLEVARGLGDALASSFGMSREAAALLDAQIERAAS